MLHIGHSVRSLIEIVIFDPADTLILNIIHIVTFEVRYFHAKMQKHKHNLQFSQMDFASVVFINSRVFFFS